MNLIIPMAGVGKRMRPHTLSIPKPLIPIAGKPIVQRLAEEIVGVTKEKIEEISFIIGAFGSEVESQLLGIAQQMGAEGKIYYQTEPLGTAHAILSAKESLKGNVIVAFADTLFDANFVLDTQQDGIIWTHKVENPSAFGVVTTDNNGVILDFVEKPKTFISNEAIIGIYYFKDGEYLAQELQYLLDNHIVRGTEYQLTDALQNMKEKGSKFYTGSVKEWLDCGNKDATVYTNQRILELKTDTEQLVSDDCEIINSIIIPPCYIGRRAKIIASVIGPHVSIGQGAVVQRSVISNSILQEDSESHNLLASNSMIGNSTQYFGKSEELSVGAYNVIEK